MVKTINSIIKKMITKCESDVNYLRVVVAPNKTNSNTKLSVVLHYAQDQIFRDLNGNIYTGDTNSNRLYYGLNPIIGVDKIIELIKNKTLSNRQEMETYISLYPANFLLHETNIEYIKENYLRALLQAASNFGIEFSISTDVYNKLDNIIKCNPKHFIEGVTFSLASKPYKLTLYGYPVKEILVLLDGAGFMTDGITLFNYNNQEGENLTSFYQKDFIEKIKLLKPVYYNGVMPRVLQLIRENNNYGNQDVIIYKFYFELTTFATVQLFDNAKMTSHPLLNKYLLEEYDKIEDSLLEHFYLESENEIEKAVNSYLLKSHNSNTLGVSANILTSDRYLIMAIRAAKTIDGGTVYCSANGQSEILDKNVAFYNNSVYEDLPSIDITSNWRLDLQKEIKRECFAELGLELDGYSGTCEGISVLMIDNRVSDTIKYRRFHFNVLFDFPIAIKYSEVMEHASVAVERFENDDYFGLNIQKYESRSKLFLAFIINSLTNILKSRDLVMTLLTVIVLVMSVNIFNETEILDKTFSILTIAFSFVLFILFIVNLITNIKEKLTFIKNKMKIVLIYNEKKDSIHRATAKCLRLIINKKKYKMHPIALVMLIVYLVKRIK